MICDSLIVYRHEVSRLLRSLRFRVSFVLIVLLFAGGSRLFVSLYMEQQATYKQLVEDEVQKERELSDNLTNFANHLRIFRYSPRTDGFLYGCKEEEMVNSIQYNVWNAGRLEVEQGMLNPLLDTKSSVDWTFIVSIFISFIALLFSYDSICGEKRDKVLGYLLPSIYTPSFIYKLLGFIGISLLLITLCVCFGLFASVMTRHSNVSLLICVSFWLFGTIIIPNSATFWGYTLYPTPLLRDIAQEVEAKESQLTKEAPPGSMAQQSENPFYPYHERRAILWMKKKEVREKSYRDYYECLIRQFEGVRRLTLLSPTVQYERAMEALLGGGHLRFQKNWRDLQAFQLTFLAWFKQKDAEDPESPHWYNPYEDVSTSRKSFDIKEAPRYQERSVPLEERLALIGLYALTTFFFIALLGWGGFRLLEKYDVR